MLRRKCIDIDECKEYRGICEGKLHCTNTVGSYICGCRPGYKTKITPNFELLKNIPSCLDIDECKNWKICPDNSDCKNTAGGYNCQCHAGFQGDLCEDIDECTIPTSCHSNATCSNKEGSYKCSCNVGFYGNGTICEEGQCDDRQCFSGQKCVSPTSDECACEKGLSLDKETDLCVDINECSLDHECHPKSTCANSEGSYTCICNPGYYGNGRYWCRKGNCTEDLCPQNEQCVSPTGLSCRCYDGFERDASGTCVDTDECSADICDENADCFNTDASFKCSCRQGFFGNGLSCVIGSCTSSNCPERQKCVSPTTTDCECAEGFLSTPPVVNDALVCADIDECATGTHKCDENANCTNTVGSFNCLCNTGFYGDGFSCFDLSKWILVLYAANFTESPFKSRLIDGKGQSKEIEFDFGENTAVVASCSIVWQGKMFMFGGYKLKTQISTVEQCQLTAIGNLEFDMDKGACAQRNDAEVFICFADAFNNRTTRSCHRSTGPLESFSKLPDSTYHHGDTRIAATSGEFYN